MFFQRRFPSVGAISAFMQTTTTKVDTKMEIIPAESCLYNNTGVKFIDRGTLVLLFLKQINNGVLRFESTKLAIIYCVICSVELNHERNIGFKMTWPINGFYYVIKFLSTVDLATSNHPQNPISES